jgi:hypothetical protein
VEIHTIFSCALEAPGRAILQRAHRIRNAPLTLPLSHHQAVAQREVRYAVMGDFMKVP